MSETPKFGTSGLRGLASDLLEGVAERFATGFLTGLGQGAHQVLVGRDLRASSPDLMHAVARGAALAGAEVLDCGEVPTPALALESQRLGLPAIMVTGSHIPAERNGLKFYLAGNEINKAEEAAILSVLPPQRGDVVGPVLERDGVMPRYLARYRGALEPGSLAGVRIGVWSQSTVLREALPSALEESGAELIEIGRSPHFVAVDTEALGREQLVELESWVSRLGLEALVSADGDGDRPLIVDGLGRQVRGDLIGALTARAVGARSVVTPVTSNSGIEDTGWFERVVRTRVGSPFVIEAMQSTGDGVVVGFEANGGVLLGSVAMLGTARLAPLPTRDALLPILAVLGASAGSSVAHLVDSVPMRATASGRLEHVPVERMAALMQRLREDDEAAGLLGRLGPIAAVNATDGLRYTLAGGSVVHIRPSGNAPELRCYTEAATPEGAAALLSRAISLLAEAVGSDR